MYAEKYASPVSATTIRVSREIRDRLNLLSSQRDDASLEQTIEFLIDELWKSRCVEQADHLREADPSGWQAGLAKASRTDRYLHPEKAA